MEELKAVFAVNACPIPSPTGVQPTRKKWKAFPRKSLPADPCLRADVPGRFFFIQDVVHAEAFVFPSGWAGI